MLKVGITGSIGAGKSTACKALEWYNIHVFNCDEESKKILFNNLPKIIELFGDSVLENGEFKKYLLSKIVFADKSKLEQLNNILHPLVHDALEAFYEKYKAEKIIVVENAILFESGSDKKVDYIVTIAADEEIRVKRAMLRDNVKEEDVRLRIKHQLSQEFKIEHSDFVIYNNGDDLELAQQVDKLVKFLNEYEKK